ncbi:arginine--tRNA ligase domain-containing protein, partial [Vibrio parahaemolyticus]
ATIASVELAGAGYLNIRLQDRVIGELAQAAATTKVQPFKEQVVVTEYSDPNPFKVLHVGHLYPSVVGDAISTIIEAAGGEVHRVNFGG